jgi:AbrB family looped-hinge helix DNA binding protein
MATQITTSSKGQIVLPKRTRDRLGIASGTILDVIDTPTGVELRPARRTAPGSVRDAVRRAQSIMSYDGPRLDDEEWRRAIDEAVAAKWRREGA